jgi:zinc protease
MGGASSTRRVPMRYFRLAILPFLISLVAAALVSAQTAEDLVEKHIAALGGRDVLSKLQSRLVTGTISVTTPGGDVKGSLESYNKAPNKSRRVVKMDLSSFGMGEMVVDQRFDGTVGYVIDAVNGNRELSGRQLEDAKSDYFPSTFLKYKELEIKVEAGGTEKVGDREARILIMTSKSGTPMKFFLDSETMMAMKMVATVNVPQLGGDIEQTTEFGDYREVDGVKIPFEVKVTNTAQSITIKFSKVEHNKEIDDAMFSKPVEK